LSKSLLHSGASLLLKVGYETGQSKTIGYARNLTYTVSNGQKMIFVVDSPIPAEIAQNAAPTMVKGSLTVYLPKGTNPEAMGLVSYRVDSKGAYIGALSKFISFQVFDRFTLNVIMSLEFCKVGSYTVTAQARGIVEVQLSFDGQLATPGLTT
jgi:hypothetical protein